MTIWPSTKITRLLKIKLPIIQAPMAGGATTPELVAAVSNTGGLGSLAAGYMHADAIRQAIIKIRQLTDKPFAVNLFINEEVKVTQVEIQKAWSDVIKSCNELIQGASMILPQPPYVPLFEEQMKVIIEEKVPIFSFTFGIPSKKWLQELKTKNVKLIGTATSLQEAVLLEKSDIDIIVAQGSEAGGHRGTFVGKAEDALIGINSLVPCLVDNLNVPIVAAGGIMDARGIVSSLILGAQGVQMGTAFLTCPESGIHPAFKKLLLQTKDDSTVLTKAFSGKLARGIRNKFIYRMKSNCKNILPYPIQHAITSPMRKLAMNQNCVDFMSMWAGQSASLSKGLPATQLIAELAINVEKLLNISL